MSVGKSESSESLTEKHKFSQVADDSTIRNVVYQRDDGTYRVDQTIIQNGYRYAQEDIHGKMDDQALIAWLTNSWFTMCYMSADKEERKWML